MTTFITKKNWRENLLQKSLRSADTVHLIFATLISAVGLCQEILRQFFAILMFSIDEKCTLRCLLESGGGGVCVCVGGGGGGG